MRYTLSKIPKATGGIFDISQNDFLNFFETFILNNNFPKCFPILSRIGLIFFRYSIVFIKSVKSKVAKNEEKRKKHAHTKILLFFLISPR